MGRRGSNALPEMSGIFAPWRFKSAFHLRLILLEISNRGIQVRGFFSEAALRAFRSSSDF